VVVNVERIVVGETENHAPICADGHRPEPRSPGIFISVTSRAARECRETYQRAQRSRRAGRRLHKGGSALGDGSTGSSPTVTRYVTDVKHANTDISYPGPIMRATNTSPQWPIGCLWTPTASVYCRSSSSSMEYRSGSMRWCRIREIKIPLASLR